VHFRGRKSNSACATASNGVRTGGVARRSLPWFIAQNCIGPLDSVSIQLASDCSKEIHVVRSPIGIFLFVTTATFSRSRDRVQRQTYQMSALKPPMTPASMGSLPTPTAQVLPSPARQNVGVNVSHTPSAMTSPYRSSNPHLAGTQSSRPEQAVVFVFDATYLTREMYFKLTAKGGSLEGIMRRLVDNGKQSLRVGKASDGPTSAGKANAKEVAEQGKGKGKANEDEGSEVRYI
jgi:hypothetical protein